MGPKTRTTLAENQEPGALEAVWCCCVLLFGLYWVVKLYLWPPFFLVNWIVGAFAILNVIICPTFFGLLMDLITVGLCKSLFFAMPTFGLADTFWSYTLLIVALIGTTLRLANEKDNF